MYNNIYLKDFKMQDYVILKQKMKAVSKDLCDSLWSGYQNDWRDKIIDQKVAYHKELCELAIRWYCLTQNLDFNDYFNESRLSMSKSFEGFRDSTRIVFNDICDVSSETPMNKALYIMGIVDWIEQQASSYFSQHSLKDNSKGVFLPIVNSDIFIPVNTSLEQSVSDLCHALWRGYKMSWATYGLAKKVKKHIEVCENTIKWYCAVEGIDYDKYFDESVEFNPVFESFRDSTRVVFDDICDLSNETEVNQQLYIKGIVGWLKDHVNDYFYANDITLSHVDCSA